MDGEVLQIQVHQSDVFYDFIGCNRMGETPGVGKGKQIYGCFSTERIDESTCQ